MDKQPSKYHTTGFTGKEPKWYWNSSHEDLTQTTIVNIGYEKYCYYCGRKALPIQGNLRHRSYDSRFGDDFYYRTTGHNRRN